MPRERKKERKTFSDDDDVFFSHSFFSIGDDGGVCEKTTNEYYFPKSEPFLFPPPARTHDAAHRPWNRGLGQQSRRRNRHRRRLDPRQPEEDVRCLFLILDGLML